MLSLLRKTKEIPQEINGVRVRFSSRAKSMYLGLDLKRGDIVLTWPKGNSGYAASRFIEENEAWIKKHRIRLSTSKVFFADSKIRILGSEYNIVHIKGRGVSRFDGDDIIVYGREEHLSRRIKDFLKKTAKDILERESIKKLEQLDLQLNRIRVIDPKTRWGSCTNDGVLMFSWRLILMPPEVLDYIVAHEVSHRIYMNHSKKFWKLCGELTIDATKARRWVRLHGTKIMSYH